MKFKFEFIPQGAAVKTDGDKFVLKSYFQGKETISQWDRNSTVIFDTGNQIGDGIIDHHMPGTEDSCVTSLVVHKLKEFIGNLDSSTEELTMITHFFPDFDAIGGVYFAKKYFESGEMPFGSEILAEYINEVDSGKLTLDVIEPINPASMILAISDLVSKDSAIPFPEKHLAILNRSFELLDGIIEIFKMKQNPWMSDFLDDLQGFDDLKQMILDDANTYKQDLSRSVTQTLKLVNNQTGKVDNVDFIATEQPQSFLWKYWVRGDRVNSTLKEGFIFTCAFFDTFKAQGRNRAIIATDPNTPYNLKGLGILIEKFEIQKLITIHGETKETLTENSRPGFHRADPWYDGRAPIHNFTIIDAPRSGSALSNEDILNCIRSYELWQYMSKNSNMLSEYQQILNFEVLSDSMPDEEELSNLYNVYLELDYKNMESAFDSIEIGLKKLMHFPVINDFVLIKKEQIRIKTYEFVKNFFTVLPKSEISRWSLKFAHLLCTYFPAEFSYKLIRQTTNISFEALLILINRVVNELSTNEIYPLINTLINNHINAYHKLREGIIEEDNRVIITKEYHRKIFTEIIKTHCIIQSTQLIMESNPIYGLKSIKNFVDDIIVTSSFLKIDKIPDEVFVFIKNDYSELRNIYSSSILFDNSRAEYYKEFEHIIKKYVFEPHLGVNLSIFRNLRAELLSSPVGKEFSEFKKLNPEDYLKLNSEQLDKVIKHFEGVFDLQNESHSKFLQLIRMINSVAVLKNLLLRVSRVFSLRLLSENDLISEFLQNEHPDLYRFSMFVEKIFDSLILKYNETDDEKYVENIKVLLEIANLVKTLPKSTEINYSTLMENIYLFLSNILLENETPISDTDKQLEICFEQYAYLTKENDNLFHELDLIPKYFSSSLEDVFYSYRRYYIEKIKFLQSELKSLSESNNDEDEQKHYFYLSTKLATETIKYEWDIIKKTIDYKSDSELGKNFYQKYFAWHELTSKINKDTALSDFKIISENNSKIRKVVGLKKINLETKVKRLPDISSESIFKNHLEYLFSFSKPFDISSHFQYNFYLLSYEYLSDHYIERYDIDTVSNALENFSSEYPRYMKILTNTRIIQLLTVIFIVLLLGASVFNSSYYPLNDDEGIETIQEIVQLQAPVSEFFINVIGDSIVNIINSILSSFWLLFIGLLFFCPLFFGILKLFEIIFLKNKKSDKLSFLVNLEKIEGKRSNLLYLQFLTPLLIVLLQIASEDTIDLLNNYTGLRFVSLLIIIIGLIYFSVLKDVAGKNPNKNKNWISKKATHLIWLYYLQSLIVTIFLVDLVLRYQVNLSELYESANDYFFMGISKYVYFQFNIPVINIDFDIVLMPIATILISLLSLFFSFFVDRVFGGNE